MPYMVTMHNLTKIFQKNKVYKVINSFFKTVTYGTKLRIGPVNSEIELNQTQSRADTNM